MYEQRLSGEMRVTASTAAAVFWRSRPDFIFYQVFQTFI